MRHLFVLIVCLIALAGCGSRVAPSAVHTANTAAQTYTLIYTTNAPALHGWVYPAIHGTSTASSAVAALYAATHALAPVGHQIFYCPVDNGYLIHLTFLVQGRVVLTGVYNLAGCNFWQRTNTPYVTAGTPYATLLAQALGQAVPVAQIAHS